jgi:hypothetical protein
MRNVAAAAAAVLALAVPTAAEGATYFNGDAAHGAYVIGTSSHLDTLEIFCSGGDTFSNRELRFDAAQRVDVKKHKFSYSGTGYRYGPQGEPQGKPKLKLSGRTSKTGKSIRIDWTLPDCGSGSSTATLQG